MDDQEMSQQYEEEQYHAEMQHQENMNAQWEAESSQIEYQWD